MFQLKLISFIGLFVFVFMAWILSNNRARFSWRLMVGAILLQLVFAVAVFSTRKLTFPDNNGVPRYQNGIAFAAVDGFFAKIEDFTDEGRKFVFNVNPPQKLANANIIADPDDAAISTENSKSSLLRTFAFGVLPTVIFFSGTDVHFVLPTNHAHGCQLNRLADAKNDRHVRFRKLGVCGECFCWTN